MHAFASKQTKIALAAFLVMSASIAVNLFAFQEKRPSRKLETSVALQPAANAGTSAEPVVLRPGDVAATQSEVIARAEPAMSRAEIIRGIQRELQARGYEPGAADGMAGLVTRAAIMAYEHDSGLPLTAETTQDLLGRIVLGPAVPAVARPGRSELKGAEAQSIVRLVGQLLGSLGYKGTNTAGMLDEKLVKAILAFEADQKLPETGRISAQLVSRLVRLQGQIKPAAQR